MKPRSAARVLLYLSIVAALIGATVVLPKLRGQDEVYLTAGQLEQWDYEVASAQALEGQRLARAVIEAADARELARIAEEETAKANAAKAAARKARQDELNRQRASRSAAAPRTAAAAPVTGGGDIYDRLASCESGDGKGSINPRAVGGGGRFHGAFQFMLSTWRNVVAKLGLPYSGDPKNHSYAEQKTVVMRGIPISSWGSQFPHCSRRIGAA